MKLFSIAGILILLFSCSAFFQPSSTILLSGKISMANAKAGSLREMKMVLKSNKKLIAVAEIDSADHYQFMYTDEGNKVFEFYITNLFDTLLLNVDSTIKYYDEAASRDFSLPKKYKLQNKKAACPKCNRTDSVLKIIYGDGAPVEYDRNGNQLNLAGGCLVSSISPNWFCKRDRVRY